MHYIACACCQRVATRVPWRQGSDVREGVELDAPVCLHHATGRAFRLPMLGVTMVALLEQVNVQSGESGAFYIRALGRGRSHGKRGDRVYESLDRLAKALMIENRGNHKQHAWYLTPFGAHVLAGLRFPGGGK